MTDAEKEQVDRMYAGFHRTPLVSETCPDCARPVLYAHDEEGHLIVLDATLPAYIHIKDWEPGSPIVRKATAYVEHAALCRATRRAAA